MARLDGMSRVLPNPDLFIAMYVKKEALLSSQIEGTQASLRAVLEVEASLETDEYLNEIGEVINYIDAMRYGLETVRTEPISVALIKEIHWLLLREHPRRRPVPRRDPAGTRTTSAAGSDLDHGCRLCPAAPRRGRAGPGRARGVHPGG